MVGVREWAEVRAMRSVERLSIKEIARRTGHSRNTIRAALRSPGPPSYGPRPARPSKLDPFKAQIHQLLRANEGQVPSQVIRERITEAGYRGGKTICDDYVRELRPVFAPPRTFQRTHYEPGELVQFDLWEPSQEIPVGHGQTRRGWVVTSCSGYSRAGAGALIFSKEAPDLLWGMGRCLAKLGALPRKVVWDREGAIHRGGGQPTDAFAALCGQLGLGWVILDPGDCQAKGMLERLHDFIERSFEPARSFANELDYQDQLDAWFSDRANARVHRTLRAVPAERLVAERELMRPPPDAMPDLDRRFVTRVAASPTCASTPTTTRSTRISPVAASRSASRSARSPRWRSTAASSLPATAVPSPSTSPSPTPLTSESSSACAASDDVARSPRSRSDPWPATTR